MTSSGAHHDRDHHNHNPLFPPTPTYGAPTLRRRLRHLALWAISSVLSLCFLLLIVFGTLAASLLPALASGLRRRRRRRRRHSRPFGRVERERAEKRREDARVWKVRRRDSQSGRGDEEDEREKGVRNRAVAGGEDRLVCDVGYYARRVGLEVEEVEVVTEDGFLIALQHVFDPDDPPYYPAEGEGEGGPASGSGSEGGGGGVKGRRKYPVLLMHGLLQSSGAFCVNDEDSLAFYLCKSGYDVWLGNNRCGFSPKHTTLHPSDPRMWSWNIHQMGTLDLPALISHVLRTTRFAKLGLVCHSQGTTQTFVALAKHQRPDIGPQISVFCALAPAAYAGPLIDRPFFKFISSLSPRAFKLIFGLHAFIPFMMTMHSYLPPRLYGRLGYRVFWFLFGWSDERWDRALRDRFFRFAPVYVSAEAMRWWLGRDFFAKHKCILSTPTPTSTTSTSNSCSQEVFSPDLDGKPPAAAAAAAESWYDDRCPPMAFWVAGSDHLVDGRKLIDRFRNGQEPAARLVHAEIIDGYEHLDVIWAVDAPEKVFGELAQVLWRSVDESVKVQVVAPSNVGGEGSDGKVK